VDRPGAVGADEVALNHDVAGSRSAGYWTVDPDPEEVARDHVARTDRVLRRVDRNAFIQVSLHALAVDGQSDQVVEHTVSGRGRARDHYPGAGVRGNGISPGRVGSADHVTGGVVDQDAVAAVTRVARAQSVSAA